MTEHIVVGSEPPRIQYAADGTTSRFETPFPVFKPDALQIFIDDAEVPAENYAVDLDGDLRAAVVFAAPPPQHAVVTITRVLPIERASHFQEGGALRADVLNYEFNYQMACLQQLADNLNRSMIMPPYAIDPSVQLKLPTPTAGKSIMWSADGKSLVNSSIEINSLLDEIAAQSAQTAAASQTATAQASAAETHAATATAQATIATNQAAVATQKAAEAVQTLAQKASVSADNFSAAGKEAIVILGRPDDARAISFSTTSPYTCPNHGYVSITINGSASGATNVQRNGKNVGYAWHTNTYVGNRTNFPVSKNDVIAWSGPGGVSDPIFAPLKGV
ncbi:MAG: hypothetical protein PHX68_01250 [Alphaproteobacteria bacterium]|nr:hypothetical protein [Alphaproteobacteria bacterium]